MARKKPINSRAKGARGERELATLLKDKYGYETARRGQQFCGANGDADVVGVKGLHIECKRVEKLNLDKAMEQAMNDARSGEIPAVFHRKDKDYWKVTVTLEDFMELWQVYEREVLKNE
jgi:Holliday junction resolvase